MCNSCASLAGLVLCFIACFILLVIAHLHTVKLRSSLSTAPPPNIVNLVQKKLPKISGGIGVPYGKVGLLGTKVVESLTRGKIIAKVPIDCIYEVIHAYRKSYNVDCCQHV